MFAATLALVPRPPRAVVREAWPGAVALLVGFVPYYIRTLHVLSDRYGVGTGKKNAHTFSGRPVWEDALHFLAPGRHDLNYFTALAIVGVVALLVLRRWRVVAFCACWIIFDELHINTLAVAPEHRRRRVATRLLTRVLGEAAAAGVRKATLEVRASNQAALLLYERLGFHVTAVRERYYTQPDEDALILWRDRLSIEEFPAPADEPSQP